MPPKRKGDNWSAESPAAPTDKARKSAKTSSSSSASSRSNTPAQSKLNFARVGKSTPANDSNGGSSSRRATSVVSGSDTRPKSTDTVASSKAQPSANSAVSASKDSTSQDGSSIKLDGIDIVFERHAEQKPDELIEYIESTIRPWLIKALESEEDRLEVLRNPGRWKLVEIDQLVSKLEKNFAWSSPSYNDALLKETSLKFGDTCWRVTYDCMIFLLLIITDKKWRHLYEQIHRADEKGGLGSFKADIEMLMSGTDMRECLGKCVYMLFGSKPYVGMTSRSGESRWEEHRDVPISIKVAKERAELEWEKWKTAAIYVPPPAFQASFPAGLLFFIEHAAGTAVDSVRNGLNTRAFDRTAFDKKITLAELEKFIVAVLDDLCPKDPTGARKKVGPEVISVAYFVKHHERYSKLVDLSPGAMRQILIGGMWEFATRAFLQQHGVDAAIWASGFRPVRLLETKQEREAVRAAYKASTTVGDELEGWTEGRNYSKSQPKNFPNREAFPSRKAREAEFAQDGADADGASEKMEESPWFEREPGRAREIQDQGLDWMDKMSFGY
ncbi:hypothetical protein JCM10908_002457 [Rhodotorula pacifica]|uniref:uncharacterized protein n=1 Tax=Rhodotorula pacifica TaxID=1495444 RepID=UPI0031727191